jgi:hypothetical protein
VPPSGDERGDEVTLVVGQEAVDGRAVVLVRIAVEDVALRRDKHPEVRALARLRGLHEDAGGVGAGWSDVVVHHDDGGAPVPGTVFDEHGKVVNALNTGGSGQAAFRVRLGKYKVELGGRKKTLDIRLPMTDVTI